MNLLAQFYASAPSGLVEINTLEIASAAFDTIRICDQFEDFEATTEESETQTFIASAFAFKPPDKNDSASQTLNFAIENVTGIAQKSIQAAIEAGAEISVTYRLYLYPHMSEPAEPPIKLSVSGAEFDSTTAQFQAAVMDIINRALHKHRYNVTDHRGLKYIGA